MDGTKMTTYERRQFLGYGCAILIPLCMFILLVWGMFDMRAEIRNAIEQGEQCRCMCGKVGY